MLRTTLAAVVLAAAATAASAQEPRTDRSPAALTGEDDTLLVFYNKPGLRGPTFTYTGSTGNIGSLQRVESLRTVGGAWQICDRHGFRGECRIVEGRYLSISRTGLRQIRSIRPADEVPAG